MNTSTARFAATVAATSALLLGVGLGANAIARSGDDPTSTAPLGDAVMVESTPTPSTDDSTSTPEASSSPTEVSHSPEVEDLDDDHGSDSSGDDDRVALPPSDDRIDDLSKDDDGAGHDADDDRVTGVDDSHDDEPSDGAGHDADDDRVTGVDDGHDDEPEIEHEKD